MFELCNDEISQTFLLCLLFVGQIRALFIFCLSTVSGALLEQCDLIRQFIGLWSTFNNFGDN